MAMKHTVVCDACGKEEKVVVDFGFVEKHSDGETKSGVAWSTPGGWSRVRTKRDDGAEPAMFDICSDECMVEFYSATDTTDCAPEVPAQTTITILRAELLKAWQYNHAENCTNILPCDVPTGCNWPLPEVLHMTPEKAAEILKGATADA